MIRTFLYLLLITFLGISFYYLSMETGRVNFEAFGYTVETSIVIVLCFLLVANVLLILLFRMVNAVIFFPKNITTKFKTFFKLDEIKFIEETLAAISNHSYFRAQNLIKKLANNGASKKLLNLLQVDSIVHCENIKTIKSTYSELIKFDETKVQATEGLLSIAVEEKNWLDVKFHALNLIRIYPTEFTLIQLLEGLFELKDWRGILDFLDWFNNKEILTKEKRNMLFGITAFKLAEYEFEKDDFEQAAQYLSKSVSNLGDFIPALSLLTKIYLKNNQPENAVKVLKQAWKNAPSLEISKLVLLLKNHFEENKFIKIIENIASYAPDTYETYLLLAKVYLDAGRYKEASDNISMALEGEAKFRACLIMAEYCQKTHGNILEVLDWIKKAVNSKLDLEDKSYYLDFTKLEIRHQPTKYSIEI